MKKSREKYTSAALAISDISFGFWICPWSVCHVKILLFMCARMMWLEACISIHCECQRMALLWPFPSLSELQRAYSNASTPLFSPLLTYVAWAQLAASSWWEVEPRVFMSRVPPLLCSTSPGHQNFPSLPNIWFCDFLGPFWKGHYNTSHPIIPRCQPLSVL